jgi:succinylglutamate desuccinylase
MSLIPNNDFLTLTRQHEWHLSPFSLETDSHDVEVWDTGVIYFSPKGSKQTEKAYVFSSAVHGNETAPIEICDELIQSILTGKLMPVHPVLFIFGNVASINIGERFVEENMNRLFNGMHSKGVDPNGNESNDERVRAQKLEAYVTRFFEKYPNAERTHYDLHTAIRDSAHEKFAVYPFLHGKPWSKTQFEILRAMGVTTFLLMETPATTFSYYSSYVHGAHSFTIELGKVRSFGENDQSKFAAAKQTLSDLLVGKDFNGSSFDQDNYQMMRVFRTINKNHHDFQLSFSDDVANFTAFSKGDVLGTEAGTEIRAEQDGEAIVFPNANVALGQRAILIVLPSDVSHNLI